ncbi:site-2 protease family protein [Candidatus Uhrbacteria bacterium]|nr:site-2 protease family protein [Candidatus Uhrbacteria bacterium]
MNTVLILAIVLSVLILVHELGHFAVAKLFGIGVEEFGFGFPPRIFGIKRGETTYSVNWIPLGGFVRIRGENGSEPDDPRGFAGKRPWQRAAVLCAGVFMNLVLAWALLTVGYAVGLPAAVDDLPAYASISQDNIQVMSVLPGSAAESVGLQAGDVILSLDGRKPESVEWFREYTGQREGQEIAVTYGRDQETVAANLVPQLVPETERAGFGVAIIQTGIVSYPVWLAPIQAAGTVGYFFQEILSAFGGVIRNLALGQPVGVELSGPIGIAVITAEVAQMGFLYLLQFAALLSVNLAVINILPFPALDGGRLLFLAIETVRRRAVSPKVEAMVHNVGFAILMILILLVTYGDIVHLGDRIGQVFGG